MTANIAIKEIQKTFGINHIYARRLYTQANKSDLIKSVEAILEEKPKPFVKWIGGKRQLLKQFRDMELYPPSKFDPVKNTYYEPFVGGGAVFFDMLPERAVLSDLNSDLVITYNTIKNNVEDLIYSLKKHKYEKDYYNKIRAIDPSNISDLDIASRFIFLNRTCFNGMYRVNSRGQFNVPFGKYSNPLICDEKNLRKVSDSLKNVDILEQDYKKVALQAKKGDFVYFDPPYFPVNPTSSFTSYTKEGFLEKEQIELRDIYETLHKRGVFVMLSNSDTPLINSLYSKIEGVSIHKIEAGRSINSVGSKRGKILEVLVTNY